jgi:hypothetical protein
VVTEAAGPESSTQALRAVVERLKAARGAPAQAWQTKRAAAVRK